MDLWIPITLAAAFCQNLRSALQKRLQGTLSTWGATASRFVYAAPLAVAFLLALTAMRGETVPVPTQTFYLFGIAGGLAQIMATGLLIHLFTRANFTAATAFTKTEPIQTAIFGIVLLGDQLSLPVVLTILVSLMGVLLISLPEGATTRWRPDNKLWIGAASGGLFGLSSVAFRGASLSLPEGDVFLRASTTLAFVTLFQAVAVLFWMRLREKAQVGKLIKAWPIASLVGISGMLGSLAWFSAFTLENAAHVRALGQVEVVLTIAISVFYFREKLKTAEIIGVLLVAAGVVGLVLLTG